MNKITILLKPTEECNFRCKYCYHADSNYVAGKMPIDLFDEIIRKSFAKYTNVHLTFHGGEPLLMGYDWYEKAFAVINKYKRDGLNLEIGIQTNGYLLNEKIFDLFNANNVGVGVSFDGPGNLNCLRDKTEEIIEKIITLSAKGYKIGLLGVVTKKNLYKLKDYYDFAKEKGFGLTLNPVFESGGAKCDNDYLISSKDFISELKRLFPIWIKELNSSVETFEPLIGLSSMAIIGRGITCETCGCLLKWVSVNYNGTLFPCSQSYPDEYCMGNIKEISDLSEAFNHKNYKKLLIGAIERRNFCQETCEYYSICQGGCNNYAILKNDITKPSGFMCEIYKEMVPFIKKYVKEYQHEIKNKYLLKLMTQVDLCQI